MSKSHDDFDNAWKEVLAHYFPDFISFFFPQAHAEIDWECGLEFLDKELQYAVRRAGRGRRAVDTLAKVWRKDGGEAWVLAHVEIQSQVERTFAQRMFICNTLLYGRHKRCVVSLGILGDTQADWKPDGFEYGMWGSRTRLEFPVVKLLDYQDRFAELEQSANPFAVVVMAHLKTQATRRKPETRLQAKVRLLRWLYQQGRQPEEFVDLFRFIDLVMPLPSELEEDWEEALAQIEEEQKVPLLSNYERRAIDRGLKKGMEQGLQQGSVQATRDAVLEVLALRFSEVPQPLSERICRIDDPSVLKDLHRKAVTASSLEEFAEALAALTSKA